MFETVSPEALIRSHRKLWYETLPVSLGIHVVALALVGLGAMTRASFPDDPPHLMFAYSVADLNPAPPPPPPPPPPPRSSPAPVRPVAAVPDDKIFAPTVIPDTIPVVQPVETMHFAIAAAPQEAGSVAGGVPGGDPIAGTPGGVQGGQPRGVLGGVLMEDGKVHFQRNKPLPLFIERQDYPTYPEELRSRGIEDDVIVRYIIDTKGKVREMTVLEHPKHKEFESAALEAIGAWRFRPLIVDGEAREVVHELAVYFRLE